MQGLVTQSVIGLVASVSLDSGGMCGSSLWFSKNCGGGGGGGANSNCSVKAAISTSTHFCGGLQ